MCRLRGGAEVVVGHSNASGIMIQNCRKDWSGDRLGNYHVTLTLRLIQIAIFHKGDLNTNHSESMDTNAKDLLVLHEISTSTTVVDTMYLLYSNVLQKHFYPTNKEGFFNEGTVSLVESPSMPSCWLWAGWPHNAPLGGGPDKSSLDHTSAKFDDQSQ